MPQSPSSPRSAKISSSPSRLPPSAPLCQWPPKRTAPPPPSESEETDSRSEEGSEEELVQSPAKKTSPLPNGEESESEDEEEGTDDKEEGEAKGGEAKKPATRASSSKSTALAPDRDKSSSDEEEGTEDDDEPPPNQAEAEGGKAKKPAACVSYHKNTAPPPDGEKSSDEEEEESEGDDEAPLKQVEAKAKARGGKPPSTKVKKPVPLIQRSWSKDDEVRILEAVAAHRQQHEKLPQAEQLQARLVGKLDNSGYTPKELMNEVGNLKALYNRVVNRGDKTIEDRHPRLFDLSKEIWGNKSAEEAEPRDFSEICEMYPYLAEEVKALEAAQLGCFKRSFGMLGDDKARELDNKVKKNRVIQMKQEMRHLEVAKVVTKALVDLME